MSLTPPGYLIGMALVCLLLTACDNGPSGPPAGIATDSAAESVQQELVGSWVREYQQKDVRARRLLVLEPDGSFREMVRITDGKGAITEHSHEGTWLYDGTNFKRKYTRMDGKPPSRLNLPFAAFQLKFESRNEFVGIDNVHKNEVRYRRVQPETLL
jgi:hypothetical protein